jgi:predicted secreted protein
MQLGSLLAVYFVVWWLTFVAVLPIGSQSHHEAGAEIVAGSDPGAPLKPRLITKALITTVLAGGLTALLLWGISNPLLQAYWNR